VTSHGRSTLTTLCNKLVKFTSIFYKIRTKLPNTSNKPYSEYEHSQTFRVRRYTHLQYIRLQAYIRVCVVSNETRVSIANPPNRAQRHRELKKVPP